MDKQETLNKIYFHRISGYGSIQDVYKQAKSINDSITLQDVKDFFSKLPQKQTQFRYKGYNSFMVNNFLDQLQLDIADFTQHATVNDGYRYALVGVDVFSRYGWAIPIKTKQPHDVLNAFKEIIRIIGKPKSIFSDMEGAVLSNDFKQFLSENDIKQSLSLNHAPYAEVFIKTIKKMIHDRLEGEGLNIDKWLDVINPVLSKYNLSYHSSLKMSPYNAKQKSNYFKVLFNNYFNIKNERRYPSLKAGDDVLIMIKQTNKTKATDPRWTRETYKVIEKVEGGYILNTSTQKKFYNRFELLKI